MMRLVGNIAVYDLRTGWQTKPFEAERAKKAFSHDFGAEWAWAGVMLKRASPDSRLESWQHSKSEGISMRREMGRKQGGKQVHGQRSTWISHASRGSWVCEIEHDARCRGSRRVAGTAEKV